jgi:hypothetical protein
VLPTVVVVCAELLAAVITNAEDSPTPGSGAASKKPNILVIWGDDIGYSKISAY